MTSPESKNLAREMPNDKILISNVMHECPILTFGIKLEVRNWKLEIPGGWS